MTLSFPTFYAAIALALIGGIPLVMFAIFHVLRALALILHISWWSVVNGGEVTGHWLEILQRGFVAGVALFLAAIAFTPLAIRLGIWGPF